jgi:general L-amino acid transport system permease protein
MKHSNNQYQDGVLMTLWNSPRFRATSSQLLLIAAVVWFCYEIVTNTIINLERQNIASGFGFLDTTAGFSINQSLIEYSEASSYGRAFLVALLNTIVVSVIGIFFATLIGFSAGIARLSKNWVVAKIATVYIETLRNIPLLLQIFFWYFAVLRSVPSPRNATGFADMFFLHNRGLSTPMPVPEDGILTVGVALFFGIIASIILRIWARRRQNITGKVFPVFRISAGLVLGLPLVAFLLAGMPLHFDYPVLKGFNFIGGMVIKPELIALVFALSVYTGTFIAEVVRGGILAVPHGQTEAAHSLGLRNGPTLRLVIVPQALRVIIPPLTNQYLNLTKNSSLAAAIAYPDLVSVFAGTVLNQTGQAVEIILITMGVYLTLSILTSMLMNWYNARKMLVER